MVNPTASNPKMKATSEILVKGFKRLRLSGMADAYLNQTLSPESVEGLSFEERLLLIYNAESELRAGNSLRRRLLKADIFNPKACLENVDYAKNRSFDNERFSRLTTFNFIENKRHVSFEGPTGTGKSYLACAVMNAACRRGYWVRCIRLEDLLSELHQARKQDRLGEVKAAYLKYDVIMLDDWLMYPIKTDYSVELLEIVGACSGKCSLIFCSQYPNREWYNRIDCERESGTDSTLAESILDRIIHRMDVIEIKSGKSMRAFFAEDGEETTGRKK